MASTWFFRLVQGIKYTNKSKDLHNGTERSDDISGKKHGIYSHSYIIVSFLTLGFSSGFGNTGFPSLSWKKKQQVLSIIARNNSIFHSHLKIIISDTPD